MSWFVLETKREDSWTVNSCFTLHFSSCNITNNSFSQGSVNYYHYWQVMIDCPEHMWSLALNWCLVITKLNAKQLLNYHLFSAWNTTLYSRDHALNNSVSSLDPDVYPNLLDVIGGQICISNCESFLLILRRLQGRLWFIKPLTTFSCNSQQPRQYKVVLCDHNADRLVVWVKLGGVSSKDPPPACCGAHHGGPCFMLPNLPKKWKWKQKKKKKREKKPK